MSTSLIRRVFPKPIIMSHPEFMLYCLKHDIAFVLNRNRKFKVISETGLCSDGFEWKDDRIYKIENGKLFICNSLNYCKTGTPWIKSSYELEYNKNAIL